MIKPILFSTPLVRAILDDRKTMTRRVVKGLPDDQSGCDLGIIKRSDGTLTGYGFETMPYQPGDILWVRETWRENCMSMGGNRIYDYKADPLQDDPDFYVENWRPSIFMPKEAARIWLTVTAVRCERLQDITPHDAWLEGCRIGNSFSWEDHIPDLQQMCRDPLFIGLWNLINEKRGYGWDANPWVWVISFEKRDRPEEEQP